MRKYLISIFFCATLFGCEKEMVYNLPNEEPKIVMYSFLEKDSTLKVQISATVSISSPTSNVTSSPGWISLLKDSVLIAKKYYTSESVLVEFKDVILDDSVNYNINFEAANLLVLSASTTIPISVPILKVDTIQNRFISNIQTDSTMLCRVVFKDPKGVGNFYQLSVHSLVADGLVTKSTEIEFSKDDKLFLSSDQVDGVWKGVDFEGLFCDKGVDGLTYSLNIKVPTRYFSSTLGQDKKVEFRLYSLSYEYYEYFKSRKILDGYSGIPFLDPVKIYTNVVNGEGCVGGLSINSYLLNAVP